MDVDPELADQVLREEGGGELHPAERQVSAGLGLELPDLIGVYVPDDDRRARRVGVGRGPEPGHQLVCDSAFLLLMAPFDVSRSTP